MHRSARAVEEPLSNPAAIAISERARTLFT
jgi:hypothetical protein